MTTDIYDNDSDIVKTVPITKVSRQQQMVRFAPKVKCRRVPRLSSLSKEEIKSTWYTPREMSAIRKRAGETVRLLTKSPKVVSRRKDLCVDGLLSLPDMHKRRNVIEEAWEAVLMEQEYQRLSSSHDEDLLADVYAMLTRESQSDAVERGHSHAERTKQIVTK